MLRHTRILFALTVVGVLGCNRQEADLPANPSGQMEAATPAQQPREVLSIQAGDQRMLTQEGVGSVAAGQLVGSGARGFLAFGPYAALPQGSYIVTFQGAVPSLPEGQAIRLDATTGSGSVTHAETLVTAEQPEPGTLATLEFSLAESVADLEVRVEVPEGSKVILESYRVESR